MLTNIENAVAGDGTVITWTIYFRVFKRSADSVVDVSSVFDQILNVSFWRGQGRGFCMKKECLPGYRECGISDLFIKIYNLYPNMVIV